jgi:hypothetical protein
MTRLPQFLALTMVALFLLMAPATLLAQSLPSKSPPAALDTAPSNDATKAGAQAKPKTDDSERGRVRGLGSICDAVDPPCPTGCKEDTANRICVEAR